MRMLLLVTTTLGLSAAGAVAQSIGPGGSLTDSAGTVWSITPTTGPYAQSIQRNGQFVPGGAETVALTIQNGVVYGEDSTGRGWFTLSGDNQYWQHSAAPAGVVSTQGPVSSTNVPLLSTQAPTTTPCGAFATGTAAGNFHVQNGQIIAPDGSVFIAKGINVGADGMGQGTPQTLRSLFPGINFVRLATDRVPVAQIQAYAQSLASAGIVVEIEDHPWPLVNPLSGGALTTETAWYASLASAFKGNPYVWFGTMNEPQSNAGIVAQQTAIYNAIRATGNNTIVMLTPMGGGNPGQIGPSGGVASNSYASMTNVVHDFHYYGWPSNYSTDQATVTAALQGSAASGSGVAALQALPSADGTVPVIVAEYGNSTDGINVDPNGAQVLTAVQSSGYGSAAWAFNSGGPGDGLLAGGGLSSYGQEVSGYTALTAGAAASVWACTGTAAATSSQQAVANAVLLAQGTTQPTTAPADPAAKTQPELAAAQAQIATLEQQNQVLAAKVQAQLDAANKQKATAP